MPKSLEEMVLTRIKMNCDREDIKRVFEISEAQLKKYEAIVKKPPVKKPTAKKKAVKKTIG